MRAGLLKVSKRALPLFKPGVEADQGTQQCALHSLDFVTVALVTILLSSLGT